MITYSPVPDSRSRIKAAMEYRLAGRVCPIERNTTNVASHTSKTEIFCSNPCQSTPSRFTRELYAKTEMATIERAARTTRAPRSFLILPKIEAGCEASSFEQRVPKRSSEVKKKPTNENENMTAVKSAPTPLKETEEKTTFRTISANAHIKNIPRTKWISFGELEIFRAIASVTLKADKMSPKRSACRAKLHSESKIKLERLNAGAPVKTYLSKNIPRYMPETQAAVATRALTLVRVRAWAERG